MESPRKFCLAHNPKMSLFFALQDLSYHKKGLYRRCNVLEWNRVKAKTKVSSFSTGSPNVPPNVTTGYACTGHIHIRECVFCRNEIDRHEVHYSCPDWVNRIRGRVFVPNPWCQVVSNWVVRLACCFPLSGFPSKAASPTANSRCLCSACSASFGSHGFD